MALAFEQHIASQEHPCELCGEWPDDCTCPVCPDCGMQGDPACQAGECEGKTRIVCEGEPAAVTGFGDYVAQFEDVKVEVQVSGIITIVVPTGCIGHALYAARKYGLETE